jgi:hypothetical protein
MASGLPNAVFPTLRRPGLGSQSNPDGKWLVAKTQTQSRSDITGLTCIRPQPKHLMKVMSNAAIYTLFGLAGLLVGMALYWFHVPFLVLVGISIAPIIVWAAHETSKMFD